MITFRAAKHAINGSGIIEILLDGAVVGTIYPKEPASFVVCSVHATMVYDDGAEHIPQIPGWTFHFAPRRYHLGPKGEIVFDEKPN